MTTDCFPHLTNMLSAGGEGGDWQLVTFHSKYTASRHKQTGFTLDLVELKVTTNIAKCQSFDRAKRQTYRQENSNSHLTTLQSA